MVLFVKKDNLTSSIFRDDERLNFVQFGARYTPQLPTNNLQCNSKSYHKFRRSSQPEILSVLEQRVSRCASKPHGRVLLSSNDAKLRETSGAGIPGRLRAMWAYYISQVCIRQIFVLKDLLLKLKHVDKLSPVDKLA